MCIALDVGCHTLRSLRVTANELRARQSAAGYTLLRDTPAVRGLLERAQLQYACGDGRLLLIGDSAAELSASFQTDWHPLGVPADAGSQPALDRRVFAAMLEQLLPAATEPHTLCCYTCAGDATRESGERSLVAQIVRLRGYSPLALSPGMAVVLAELEPQQFTGIGISLGSGSCDMTLAHRGRELVSCSWPRGGRWVDEQFARELRLVDSRLPRGAAVELDEAQRRKESCAGDLASPKTRDEHILADIHRALLVQAGERLQSELRQSPFAPRLPASVQIVCAGGGCRIKGFTALLQQAAEICRWPFSIDGVRIAAADPFTVARGCLIQAQLGRPASRAAA